MIVLLRLTAGLIGWAAAFCLIYALHGLGCASGWDDVRLAGASVLRWVLIVAWLLSLAATVAIAIRLMRRRTTPLDRMAVASGWIGAAATLVTFAPIVIVPACT